MAISPDITEAALTRLAEQEGDITRLVIDRYYERYPEARASFVHHGFGDTAELEGRMVTETIFLLLQWSQDPASTRIEQGTTIVHHNDTLEIGPAWYMGLIDAAIAVVVERVPPASADERRHWQALREDIAKLVESVRAEFWRKDEDGPLPAFKDLREF